jgi:tRNA-splicing ligase RtcB
MAEQAAMHTWLVAPLDEKVASALRRLRHAPDVRRVAVMPDVHLAEDVCVGVVLGTSRCIYPQAVGGDIGCGMLAVPFATEAARLKQAATAARILAELGAAIPVRRRHRRRAIPMPSELCQPTLSDPTLESLWRGAGALELATLGTGNHFIELQGDEQGRLWLMVHSGSRAIGPAVRDHHLARAEPASGGLKLLTGDDARGVAYIADAAWARRFAEANRQQLALLVEEVVLRAGGGRLQWEEAITSDHNHLERESHAGESLWVHRKGAMGAHADQPGVLPGSMASPSYHVVGRGCARAMCSSAHGAGRLLSRGDARRRVTERDLRYQMREVWYDFRQAARLRDEAPSAYKDIQAVVRAQHELVRIVRRLRPVLSYKGS